MTLFRLRKRSDDCPDHWALTPDLDDPSSWRLPLTTDDGVFDARRVAAALGCLSPDAHPTIPVREARVVRRRIAAAWRALHGDTAELPAVLAKSGDMFAPAALGEDGEPRGVMVCFAPRAEIARLLAVPGGLPPEELHLTLCYLGPAGTFTPDELDAVDAVARQFASGLYRGAGEYLTPEWPLAGRVTGAAIFAVDDPGELSPAVALVDVPGLQAFRAKLWRCLAEHGFAPYATHDYLPHITLAYGPVDELRGLPLPATADLLFDELVVVSPGRMSRVPLDGERLAGRLSDRPLMIVKSGGTDRRRTMSPLYVPDVADSHNEWATADDLEEAVARYLAAGEFDINFEHIPGTRAGRCIGIAPWPREETWTLTTGDGTESVVTVPAGTVYQWVEWEPWAWEEVRAGRINALSLEGWAFRRMEQTSGQATASI